MARGRPKGKKNTVHLHLALTPAQAAWVRGQAEANGEAMTSVLRRLIVAQMNNATP